jgi:hypothetical protein
MATIDPFSLTTVPLSTYFDDTHLSDATGFLWNQGERNYLITNWHVLTGRNAQTGESLHARGGRPNKIRAFFNARFPHFEKQEHIITIRDANYSPAWLVHEPVASGPASMIPSARPGCAFSAAFQRPASAGPWPHSACRRCR